MQAQVTELLRERSTLSEQLQAEQQQSLLLRHQMSSQSANPASGHQSAELQITLENTQRALAQKSAELDAMNQHLNNSSQFQQMKQMVKDKNAQIKQLRASIVAAGFQPPGDDVPAGEVSD